MAQLPDHPCRILIIGRSGSGKTSALFNLTVHQLDMDRIYFYSKDPYEAKYQLLINKRGGPCLKRFIDFKVFVEYGLHLWKYWGVQYR